MTKIGCFKMMMIARDRERWLVVGVLSFRSDIALAFFQGLVGASAGLVCNIEAVALIETR